MGITSTDKAKKHKTITAYGNPREAVLLAYLAGIMDGEGTFAITKVKPKGYTNLRYSARITLGMVEEEIIQLFIDRYGGKARVERVHGRKPVYRWARVGDSENTVRVIEELLPYLRAKKKRAEIVLEYIRTKKTTGFQRSQGVPADELRKREDFYQKVKELNAYGAPATTERDSTREGEATV